MSEDMQKIMTAPTVGVALAARVLGVSLGAAYRACGTGDIPTLRVGSQYRVPTAKLREMLGVAPTLPLHDA